MNEQPTPEPSPEKKKPINTILINKHCRLELVASTDETRLILNGIHITEDQQAIVTDGCAMAVVPVLAESRVDIGGFTIPSKLFKHVRRDKGAESSSVDVTESGLVVNKRDGTEVSAQPIEAAGVIGPYPNWKSGLPDDGEPCFVAHLDPARLHALARAIGVGNPSGSAAVKLEFFGEEKPIRVTTPNTPEAVGVLMPCKAH